MKIGTWNVNGIRARFQQFQEWVNRDHPDVICLQEIKASPLQIPPLICDLDGYDCYWHGLGGYSGVGLHIRKNLFPTPPVFSHPSFDHENRIVAATFGRIKVSSIYVPNGGKDYPAKLKFLQALVQYISEEHAAGNLLVLCGDFNVARTDMDVHPKERKPHAIGQRREERDLIEAMIANGLVDSGRAVDPNNDGLFTWWAPWRNMRQRNIGWRLDYVMASKAIAESLESCPVLKDFGTSDHAPVIATFRNIPL